MPGTNIYILLTIGAIHPWGKSWRAWRRVSTARRCVEAACAWDASPFPPYPWHGQQSCCLRLATLHAQHPAAPSPLPSCSNCTLHNACPPAHCPDTSRWRTILMTFWFGTQCDWICTVDWAVQIQMYWVPNWNVEITRIVRCITRRYIPLQSSTRLYGTIDRYIPMQHCAIWVHTYLYFEFQNF